MLLLFMRFFLLPAFPPGGAGKERLSHLQIFLNLVNRALFSHPHMRRMGPGFDSSPAEVNSAGARFCFTKRLRAAPAALEKSAFPTYRSFLIWLMALFLPSAHAADGARI
ncbi:hypothetical protein M5E87_24825 [Flavonifractor plautii]|nr:hypothetical protein M5E87_24825 [Flavonifractor plautii]